MQRLGAGGFQRASGLTRGISLPPWKDVLMLAFVAVTVAGSVAFLGLCLPRLIAVGKVQYLPAVFEPACSSQGQKRL